MKPFRFIIFVTILVFQPPNYCKAIPVEDDLTLTPQERFALDEFKQIMDPYLNHDYMRKDIYLVKWLRAKNLNLKNAKTMLLNNLRWREENRIDTILDEDFSKFELEYPVSYEAFDYTGRPVGTTDAAQWDVRKALLSGKQEKLTRYAYWGAEMGAHRIYKLQEEGKNVTQGIVIINLTGFNLIQHACIPCLQLYINLLLAYENYYPQMTHKIITINTPSSFEVILRVLRPLMSPDTKQALAVFGTDKHVWKRYILSMIPPDQLEKQFGGTRTY